MTYKQRTECTVIIAYDGTYWCEIEKQYYHLCQISKREKINNIEEKRENTDENNSKYVPPVNYPWRKDMKKFFNKS